MHEKRSIDGGSPAYWKELKEGYQLVEKYRATKAKAEREPTHYGYGPDEDGGFREIEDNLGLWEKVDEAQEALLANSRARIILTSHGLTIDKNGSILNNKGRFAKAKEMPVFGNRGK